jgi:hypothetical protein
MASSTMTKNIFAAFGVDERDADSVTIKKITCSGSGCKTTTNALLHLEDYPALGTKITKSQKKAISSHNQKQLVDEEERPIDHIDPRSASFAAMADKKKVASSLTCTKACHLVTKSYTNPKEGEEPRFGVCSRATCSFAHSEAELQVPLCGFDGNCRFQYGKRDRKTRTILPGTQCLFRHSNEEVEEYYKRSKVQRPALPPTSKNSRKPSAGRSRPSAGRSRPSAGRSRPSAGRSQPLAGRSQLPTMIERVLTPYRSQPIGKYSAVPPVNHSRRTKSRWDEKHKKSPSPTDTTLSSTVNYPTVNYPTVNSIRSRRPSRVASDSESSSSESESSSSDSESSSSDSDSGDECRRRRRRRSTTKRRRSRSKTSPPVQIIRVPTKELAAVAIKAAFDRGQYNVKVIVEG